jgi:Mn-dependent DtxR family transcriptional regulator
MKASVTSIMAYHDLKLGMRQHEVLRAIQQLNQLGKPASCEAVSDHLGYTPNRVTGRISELRKKGAIKYDSFTKSKFNRNVETYALVSKGQQSII